ncbi:WD40 repeat-containing protein [Spraguea lophii 42_110]|uniref:WD40 repeat-containing protein n=1 Tax=Spraguea lophii (strain 42_110) TaxID=1358809 RepID=S7XSG1_SPRLO|nr:WD40 repeat-containing protein [Spraguea lophii 42_110]
MERYICKLSNKKLYVHRKITSGQMGVELESSIKIPRIMDDYYLNVLDTCGNETLIGFDQHVFIIKDKDNINRFSLNNLGYASAVKYIDDKIFVGTQNGYVLKFDRETKKMEDCHRFTHGRIPVIKKSKNGVIMGFNNGKILQHDLRQNLKCSEFLTSNENNDYGEIISFTENNLNYFAFSNSRENVSIYDFRYNRKLRTLSEHKGTVKALKFCPWNPINLVTGGGLYDKRLISWDVRSFDKIAERHTNSQICDVHFLENMNMITTHGYAGNSMIEWKSKNLGMVAEKRIHNSRVLYSAYYLPKNILATASLDQSLKLWKIKENKKREEDDNFVARRIFLR